ncbi:MAG: DUF4783 domain-containing protein [Cyclobacteriaceae bacterium]|nr:DUF4783 domain-containing protein [Cyclobacteriaceae bacterium]MCK5277037.1 DUF4783 domain-containing protein [Cyclobacteriaceae bacterium]MCK5372161.1 DUF4783 domain-containing protein [Cyclobacteriaceae bacterium]MCK5468389.1 DUF4783 domain-containing protein [Cyclobacteriaceae bacterium]MCK5705183.1 DUF4783 domain-containing protein [Cyclobacteriaceae bacterium]
MEKVIRYCFLIGTFIFSISVSTESNAQSEVINNVRAALKAGSSKELVKSFNTMVELNFEGEKSNYSRSQAELVLKEFFKKYPPTNFQYIHQGASKQGLTYVIGKYTFENGSFRVWILIKKFQEIYLVDSIDFSRE